MAKKTQKQKEFDLILKYADDIDEFTKRIRTTDLDLIRKHKGKLNWQNIINRKTINNEFIDEFWDDMKPAMPKIMVHPNMPIEFLKTNRDYVDWRIFIGSSGGARFDVDFIKTFKDEFKDYYQNILNLPNLPEESREFILHDADTLSTMINSMSKNSNLDIKTIEKYKDILNWKMLSARSAALSISTNFKKYKEFIDLYEFTSLLTMTYDDVLIKRRLKLIINEDFLLTYKDKINWYDIINFNSYRLFAGYNKKVKQEDYPLDFFKNHINELPEKVILMFDEWKDKWIEYKITLKDSTTRNYQDPYYYLKNNYHFYWEF